MARSSERKIPSIKRRILFALIVILFFASFVLKDRDVSEQKPSPAREVFIVTPEDDGLPSLRNFDFSTHAAPQTEFQPAPTTTSETAAPTPAPVSVISMVPAPTPTPPLFNAGLANPELKLAVADFPKIFNAYYKTKLARAEFAARKGDQAASDKEMAQMHDMLVAELKQVVLNYSVTHDLDAVLDSGSIMPTSGDPLVLYARPGMDITDGVIALANAGHEAN